jgi:hypothetical protein
MVEIESFSHRESRTINIRDELWKSNDEPLLVHIIYTPRKQVREQADIAEAAQGD